MSSILDEMTRKTVIQTCRNQQELIRATSVPGKPEDQGIRELNLLDIPGNGKNSSPQETRNISRYVSTPSLSFLGPPNRFNHQQRPSMLQERPTHSDNDLRGDNLSASSNERNSNLTSQPKLEHKGSVYNEATLKACKPFRRRASLPASYLDEYLSVNNIRKRAQHSGVKESDSAEARVSQKKVKSKNRKPKLRLPSEGNTDSAEVEAADEAILDSTEIHENYAEKDSEKDALPQMAPIERFRKIVQLLSFLLKVKTSIDRKHRSQNSSTVFAKLDEESVPGVDCDGMVFDPNNFKAKREVHLSLEAIHILSLSPGSRTEEQLQTVLKALKTSVAAFGEYPLKMQRRLVSVGWYERFEAKRVIIRQGHKAENFYFILSGTAVVTLLINDAKTKEERDTTVAVLGKGSSFGELALLHHKTRSATVLCKDDVSLLAVSREDFRDIFMSYEDGREPEHIRFLRSVPYLKDLPLQDLTTKHDVCIFHYFRRGVVIVKESKTKWIYVVKSGSCRVLTHLSRKTAKFSRSVIDQERQKAVLPVIPVDDGDRRRALFTAAGDRVRPTAWSPDLTRAKTEPSFTSQQDTDLSLPAIVGEPEKFKKTAKNIAIATIVSALPKEGNEKEEQDQEELQRSNTKRTNNTNKTWRKMSPSDNKNGMSDPGQKGEQVVVQIELLKPKDQFGLSMVLFDSPAVKCHLVSNGAECVLIKKSWFLQHANEALLRKLRHQIPPYPSQAKLEQKMQDQANWDSFKSQTLNTLLDTLHL
ncbi:uncharacterized protein LOC141879247 isoform X1 [Acropora palmata]|uniref:uncharacterized protein LOC141879247 isoform X1 n=1 Tax=Acropora palmata TaxID=6131 RepID=UPI003DA1878A